MRHIKKFDFLSYQAHFNFNDKGDKRYKTLMGGILSLITIVISSGFILFFSYKLIFKKDANLIFSSERNETIIIKNSYKLPFIFRLSDSFSIPLNNENLYNISFLVWYNYFDNETNKFIQRYDKVSIEKCNIEKHFGDYKKYFSDVSDLQSYFCPKERLSNQSLYGIYGDDKPFLYYVFYFSKCINLSDNNLCLSNEKIDEKLSDIYLDIKFVSYSIPKSNDLNSHNVMIESDRFLISTSVYKRIWLFYDYINFKIDNGYIFNSFINKEFHQFAKTRIDIDLGNKSFNIIPETFLALTILNSGNVLNYKKTYLKIQDYLATIGGIIKALTCVCDLLNHYNSINCYYSKIIKDFIIENQIHKKKSYNSDLLNKINNNQITTKNPFLNIPEIPKTRSTPVQLNLTNLDKSNTFMIRKLREKDRFEQRFQIKFLPLRFIFSSKLDKKEIGWNIKIINRKLNIIHVLNILEQVERKKKEVDNDFSFRSNSLLSLPNYNANKNFINYRNNSLSIIPENHINIPTNNFLLTSYRNKKKSILLKRINPS